MGGRQVDGEGFGSVLRWEASLVMKQSRVAVATA